MVHLAMVMLAKDKPDEARRLAGRALALEPHCGEIVARATEVLNRAVPDWHFSIVRDQGRNDAYEAALVRMVKPDDLVLEIGAGSGLLSMMAARAGARRVVACEMMPAVAEAAEIVVRHNGLSDRVRIVAKHSKDLAVGPDLPEPADLLVQEIISNDVLGQSVSQAIEDASRRLLKPGARMIPAAATVRVALAQDARADRRRTGPVSGFDLSPFNRVAPPRYRLSADDDRLTMRSAPADLATYDFQGGGPFPRTSHRAELTADGGPVTGVVQWMRLQMDDAGEVFYENRPGPGSTSAWAVLHHCLPEPIESRPGQRFAVVGSDDRKRLLIWADPID